MTLNQVKDTNPKDAVGSSKVPFHVIPLRVLAGIAHAFLGGALKYRAFNYRIAGVRASVYVAASMRHVLRFWEGEDWDPDVKGYKPDETGVLVHHLDEAIAGLMVLRDSMLQGNWVDDRPPAVSPGWVDEANEMTARIIAANPAPEFPWTQAEVVKSAAVAAAVEAFDANTGATPATSPSEGATSPAAPGTSSPDARPGIPLHVYWTGTFFAHRSTRESMGGSFYVLWWPRRREFPTEPWGVGEGSERAANWNDSHGD